jgi:hypothetical protein
MNRMHWVELDKALNMKQAFDHHDLVLSARDWMRQRVLYSIAPGLPCQKSLPLPTYGVCMSY